MAQQKRALETIEKTVPVETGESENIFEQIAETAQRIGQRAFELFEKRGRAFGNDLEDWLRAESELIRRVPVEIKEAGEKLEIRAEVPGFNPEDLKIFVEPNRLTINGETENKTEETGENTLYSEWRSQKIFRSLDLPREVRTNDVSAKLKDGVLFLTLPKAEKKEPLKVEVKSE